MSNRFNSLILNCTLKLLIAFFAVMINRPVCIDVLKFLFISTLKGLSSWRDMRSKHMKLNFLINCFCDSETIQVLIITCKYSNLIVRYFWRYFWPLKSQLVVNWKRQTSAAKSRNYFRINLNHKNTANHKPLHWMSHRTKMTSFSINNKLLIDIFNYLSQVYCFSNKMGARLSWEGCKSTCISIIMKRCSYQPLTAAINAISLL